MKLAAIDIGSNSVHMVVAETTGRETFEVIDREKAMVKLGAGAFRDHRLTPRAFDAGLDVLRRYRKLADRLGADEILAVATEAIRDTENGGEFLSRVGQETGIEPRVISGREEARLIYLAVRNALDFGSDKILEIDIGGGSVELIVGDTRHLLLSESVKLGVQRLRDLFGDQPLGKGRRKQLEEHVRRVAGPAIKHARALGFSRVVGTSGTIRALGDAAHRLAGKQPWRSVNAEVAELKDLKRLADRLTGISLSERGEIKGIDRERTDTIHLGSVLLIELLELARAESITLCEASLREGVILEFLGRKSDGTAVLAIPDVRPRATLQLARKYGMGGPRERHVAKLALQIFDQTVLHHELGSRERELLEYSALLFSVGQYIGFRNYQAHSDYIISNSGIRGFNDEEVELISLVVLYHRKGEPSKKHPRVKALDKSARRVLKVLSAILRVSVGLDRSNSQSVNNVRCEVKDEVLHLFVSGEDDLELAIWGGQRRSEPLGKALGLDVEVVRRAGERDEE
ncbi:MAG: Ppx/GppA family phosphatase [Myxococcales bacterium]|nr:Ppx/GppA family phosphatase [Myxococcales bacterium]